MKRNMVLLLALFLIKTLCIAQPLPPTASLVTASTALNLIQRYQSGNHVHPSSYLLYATDFYQYLSSNNVPYLHVLFASTSNGLSAGQDDPSQFLVIIGTIAQAGKLIHLPDATNTAWRTTLSQLSQPNCCIPYDNIIDPNIGNVEIDNDQSAGCNINLCVSGSTTKSVVNPYIINYQKRYPVGDTPPYPYTQSFLINAVSLESFLAKYPTVLYLQFYVGVDPTITSNSDQLTLVIVGVDQYGNHIYSNGSVFNEGIPCPKCGIQSDVAMPKVGPFLRP